MRRMLIVDDEQDICDCLEQFFLSRGFAVTSAFSGEEALDRLAREGSVEVVLLDIVLPGLSGIEVLKRVRQICPEAKVIMVTGQTSPALRFKAEALGATGYVTKPFDFSETTWAPALSK